MSNILNDIEVKGKPIRVYRTKDRDGERIEQEYERRTNSLRKELGAVKNYLVLLEAYLSELGIGVPPSSVALDPTGGYLFEPGNLIESNYYLDRDTYTKKDSDDNLTFADVNSGVVTLADIVAKVDTYAEAVSGSSSYTITHNLNNATPGIFCYATGGGLEEPQTVEPSDANELVVTFGSTWEGTIRIFG